jgi:hypothetical protein
LKPRGGDEFAVSTKCGRQLPRRGAQIDRLDSSVTQLAGMAYEPGFHHRWIPLGVKLERKHVIPNRKRLCLMSAVDASSSISMFARRKFM